MSDKEQYSDEYQFSDLDISGTNTEQDNAQTHDSWHTGSNANNKIKRNAAIVIGLLIFSMLSYKIISMFYLEQKEITPNPITTIIHPDTAPTIAPPQTPVQIKPSTAHSDAMLKQNIAELGLAQQNIHTQMNVFNTKIETLDKNTNTIGSELIMLQTTIAKLNSKIDEQTHGLAQLQAQLQAQKKHKVDKNNHTPKVHHPTYYIQALIPGRAWLSTANGDSITIRHGSIITGYGTVKLIDSHQGRIITSSGRIIRFNPKDS